MYFTFGLFSSAVQGDPSHIDKCCAAGVTHTQGHQVTFTTLHINVF